jgi:hypothetical protein
MISNRILVSNMLLMLSLFEELLSPVGAMRIRSRLSLLATPKSRASLLSCMNKWIVYDQVNRIILTV